MRFSNQSTVQSNRNQSQLELHRDRDDLWDLPIESLSPNSRAALNAVDDVSRRIENLATQLGCLGFFDQEDGPRAA